MIKFTHALIFLAFLNLSSSCLAAVKSPNVAGQFYPSDPDQLSRQINQFFFEAKDEAYGHFVPMILAPHAGYIYSGPTAAYAYKAVARQSPRTIVILAPSHYYAFNAIALWPEGDFQTPLGSVAVDQSFVADLKSRCDMCEVQPKAFDKEHSLETQIPFIQKVFPDARIVPVMVGQPSVDQLKRFAYALGDLLGQRTDVLVVVSTDWSHYHDEMTAIVMDQKGIDFVKKLDADMLEVNHKNGTTELCGFYPVMAAVFLARHQGWTTVDVLKTATSANVTGDRTRVVGYAAMAFYAEQIKKDDAEKTRLDWLSEKDRQDLLNIARATVRMFVEEQKAPEMDPSSMSTALKRTQGVFVTLRKKGVLRGCIGRIISDQPLYESVRDMAIAAASQDRRFRPVSKDELIDLDIEISVLSSPQMINEAAQIQLGRDGVILKRAGRQGVFLPQVAQETGWSKERFLSELCAQKAELPPNCWQEAATKLATFTADVFDENSLKSSK